MDSLKPSEENLQNKALEDLTRSGALLLIIIDPCISAMKLPVGFLRTGKIVAKSNPNKNTAFST